MLVTPERLTWAIVGLSGAITLWNALAYPSGAGYDANAHKTYSDYLLAHHRLPDRNGSWEYYSPPLYYIVAAIATLVGRHIGAGDPYKLAQLINVPIVVGTILVVAALARLLWPERRWLAPVAAGFVALSPVLVRTAAMFHPEPLDLLLAAVSGYLATRMLVRRRYGVGAAIGLGVTTGLAQMVRQFALYTLAVVTIAWIVAAVWNAEDRRALLRAGLLALAACIVVAGPWYGYRQSRSSNAVFDRPPQTRPIWDRRPASFYLGTGLPTVFSRPYRPHLENRAWPQTYSDIWGDWFGVFAWAHRTERDVPSRARADWLAAQNVIGIVPTLLAIGGWLGLLVAAVRRRAAPVLVVALLPLAGLLGYFFFAIAYPTVDGDVLKPTFMLSTLWAWALCFAWAATALGRRWPRLIAVTLVALAFLDLPFLVYNGALGFFS